MSLARTLTVFVIDISSTMGERRVVLDEFVNSDGQPEQRERVISNLEWCLEFVSRKTQAVIFSSLKTAQMSIITFGSPRTSNAVIDADPGNDGYQGVDEVALIGQPTVATLELLRSLRAVREDEGGHPPDPLDALICALTSMGDPERGGLSSGAKSWKRTIYLITDGRRPMNKDSTDAIAQRIKEDGVSLRVIGVDFDDEDYGFQEEDKDPIKAENEEWWHNWLQGLPESRIATAAHALEQATLPNVSLAGSAPYATALTFGDPDAQYTTGGAFSIPVKMLKLTTRVLPMSRKTMSKLAEQTESAKREKQATQEAMSQFIAVDGSQIATPIPSLPSVENTKGIANTYMVDQRRIFFFADEAKEVGTDHAQPLAEGAEEHFGRAYKLGASLIPITPDLDVEWQSKPGLEVINWVKKSTFRRDYLMGDVWNLFADTTNLEAQIQISSLAKAMHQQEKLALVRFVRRENAEPKLGVLYPVVRVPGETSAEYFHFVEVPFSEDLKRYTFPSLERVITADGKELKEHRSLPNEAMMGAMEDLVDSMDLSSAFRDENGDAQSWFSTEDSFNPAIHRMKEAVAWRVMHPESKELPRPHWEVDKFLDRPEEIRAASEAHIEKCKELFNIRYYPEKGIIKAKQKREREVAERAQAALARYELDLGEAPGDDDDGDRLTVSAPAQGSTADTDANPSQKKVKDAQGQSQSVKGKFVDDDSDTDADEEMDMLAPARASQSQSRVKKEQPSQASQTQTQTQAQTQGHSTSRATATVDADADADEEDTRPPINLLSSDPIGSFHFHLEDSRLDQGEVLRKLQALIGQLVSAGKEESSRLARDSLVVGKKAAAEYDEAQEWNEFIRRFKSDNKPFWSKWCKGDLKLGLVTQAEDEGKRSKVSDQDARTFVNS